MVGISAGNELLNKAKPENQSHNLIDALNRMHQNLKEEKIFDGTKFMKNIPEEFSNISLFKLMGINSEAMYIKFLDLYKFIKKHGFDSTRIDLN